jgi:hypothetical protein
METLEERLGKVSVDRVQLIDTLCAEKIRPKNVRMRLSYLKYNLSGRIEEYLAEKGVTLNEKTRSTTVAKHIYNAINKKPLKRVEWGIINSEARPKDNIKEIPDEIFQQLTNWEAVYFLAGLWNKKSTPIDNKQYRRNLLEKQPLPLIVAETIEAGIHSLQYIHNQCVENGEYTSELQLPYADEILQRYYSLRTNFNRAQIAPKPAPAPEVKKKEEYYQPSLFD